MVEKITKEWEVPLLKMTHDQKSLETTIWENSNGGLAERGIEAA